MTRLEVTCAETVSKAAAPAPAAIATPETDVFGTADAVDMARRAIIGAARSERNILLFGTTKTRFWKASCHNFIDASVTIGVCNIIITLELLLIL